MRPQKRPPNPSEFVVPVEREREDRTLHVVRSMETPPQGLQWGYAMERGSQPRAPRVAASSDALVCRSVRLWGLFLSPFGGSVHTPAARCYDVRQADGFPPSPNP